MSTAPPYRGAGEDQERVGGRRQGRQVGGRSASALLPAAEQFPGRSDSSRKLATLGLRGSLHCCFSSANSKGSGQRGRHRGKVFLTSVKSHSFPLCHLIFLHPLFQVPALIGLTVNLVFLLVTRLQTLLMLVVTHNLTHSTSLLELLQRGVD